MQEKCKNLNKFCINIITSLHIPIVCKFSTVTMAHMLLISQKHFSFLLNSDTLCFKDTNGNVKMERYSLTTTKSPTKQKRNGKAYPMKAQFCKCTRLKAFLKTHTQGQVCGPAAGDLPSIARPCVPSTAIQTKPNKTEAREAQLCPLVLN